MKFSQSSSVFMPGLTRRGPVYNANTQSNQTLGAYLNGLPALPSGMTLAVMGGLLALGFFKKIPLPLAAVGAGAAWFLMPQPAGAAANAAAPAMPLPAMPSPQLDLSQIPMPTMVPVAQ